MLPKVLDDLLSLWRSGSIWNEFIHHANILTRPTFGSLLISGILYEARLERQALDDAVMPDRLRLGSSPERSRILVDIISLSIVNQRIAKVSQRGSYLGGPLWCMQLCMLYIRCCRGESGP